MLLSVVPVVADDELDVAVVMLVAFGLAVAVFAVAV